MKEQTVHGLAVAGMAEIGMFTHGMVCILAYYNMTDTTLSG